MNPTTQDNPTKPSIEYVEVKLEQVINFFVGAYKLNEGEITSHKAFVDTAQNKVVLKLFIETPVDETISGEI